MEQPRVSRRRNVVGSYLPLYRNNLMRAMAGICAFHGASAGFVDKDTPLNKRTTRSLIDGSMYHLVSPFWRATGQNVEFKCMNLTVFFWRLCRMSSVSLTEHSQMAKIRCGQLLISQMMIPRQMEEDRSNFTTLLLLLRPGKGC